jgi:phytanoyl-CoA hydroxylase
MSDQAELKEAYDRDGFVRIRGLLSADELTEVRKNLERYKAEVAPTLAANRVLYDVIDGQKYLKQLVDMQDADSFFNNWLRSNRNAELAATLLGEPGIPQTLEYFEKAPHRGTPTPPHQDGYYFCLKPDSALTMWVAMDDCDEENGCLSYVRGSQHHGIIDHESSNVTGFSQGLAQDVRNRRDAMPMHVKSGDCLIHHCATIHFAGPNRSDRWRRSFGMVFYGQCAKRDDAAWDRYTASLDRQRKQAAAVN